MAVLSAAARRKLPKKDFAGPGDSYPIPDKKHAKAALMLINKGGLSAAAKAKVRAAARRKLGSSGK